MFTIRLSLITLSAPLGGILYTAGGFSLPYAAVGMLGCVAIVAMRILLRHPYNAPQHPASILGIVTMPGAMAAFFSAFVSVYVWSGMDTIWQPWLGSVPYKWPPAQIATVAACAGGVQLVGIPLVGMPFSAVFGEGVALLVGMPLQFFVSPLLMGNPPWLFPTLANDPPVWVPYAAIVISALGAALTAVPMFSLPMKAVTQTGLSQEQAATPVGVMTMLMMYVGYGLGPIANGQVMEVGGVTAAAMVNLGLGVLAYVLVVSLNWQTLFPGGDATPKSVEP